MRCLFCWSLLLCGVRLSGMRNAECGMRNAECGMRNAECGMRNAEIVRAACGLSRGLEDVSAFLLLMKKLYHATKFCFKELTDGRRGNWDLHCLLLFRRPKFAVGKLASCLVAARAAVKSGFTSLRSANLHTSFCKNRTKRPILGTDIQPIISLTTR